ncbi:hypothetical protein bcgnr5390_09990 [Bacillus luti]|nr:hypothetical protein BC2903_30920 [Bacillus cereus]
MSKLLEVVKLKVEKAGLPAGTPSHELDAKIKEGIKLAIKEDAHKASDTIIIEKDLDAVLEEIANRVKNGHIDGLTDLSDLTIELYDRVTYVYEIVFQDYEKEAIEIMKSMYRAMNGDARGSWLQGSFIEESQELYSDQHRTIVVVIDVNCTEK